MSVYKKLNQARVKFHSLELKKSGHNKFAGYYYFELSDFVVPALKVFNEVGLCAVVSFNKEMASMLIQDIDAQGVEFGGSNGSIIITSPMAELNLKGCHPIQNMGAIETYQRRYLWMAALEIVEHDAVDASQPMDDLAIYNALADKHIDSINAIKTALKEGDYSTAREAWMELEEEVQMGLWKAPSKGGCFTTGERTQMKSTEFRTANGEKV